MAHTTGEKLKLHLGCGHLYLQGYENVDYPQDSHTTITVKADKYCDLKTLDYSSGSVSEIRLHHVFEHFNRQWAYKLLSIWHQWLEPGGTLIIETPDFDECAKRYVAGDLAYRFKLLRHMRGSEEAHWAYHLDGWGEDKFKFVLAKFGFGDFQFKKTLAYHSNIAIPKVGGAINRTPFEGLKDATGDRLPNITVTCKKTEEHPHYEAAIRELLKMSMVGKETEMYHVWLREVGIN